MVTESTAVIVLGMHRSGTSAVTGVLEILGVDLTDNLVSAKAGINDKGFKEHREIVGIHGELLRAIGSGWDDVLPLPERWWESETAKPYRDRLLRCVRRDFGGRTLWGVKDPRMCLTLPLWFPIFAELEIRPRFLLPLRHPLEVAASLRKRDGFDEHRTVHLWLKHTLTAELFSRDYPRVFMDFGELMTAPAAAVSRILDGLALETGEDRQSILARVDEFVDPSLKRNQSRPEEDAELARMDPLAADVYKELTAGTAAGSPGTALDDFHARFRKRTDEFDPILTDYIRALRSREAGWRKSYKDVQNSLSLRFTKPVRKTKRALANAAHRRRANKHRGEIE